MPKTLVGMPAALQCSRAPQPSNFSRGLESRPETPAPTPSLQDRLLKLQGWVCNSQTWHQGVPYKIEALTSARGGREVKTKAFISASGTVDLGPEAKIQRYHTTFLRSRKVGPRCDVHFILSRVLFDRGGVTCQMHVAIECL